MNERDFIAGYAHAPPLALMHNHFLNKFVEHGVCRKEFDELYLRNADGEAVIKRVSKSILCQTSNAVI